MFPDLVKARKELQAKVAAHEEYMSKGKVGDNYDPPNSELKVTSTVFGEKVREQVAEIKDLRKKVDELVELHQAEQEVKAAKAAAEDNSSKGIHDDGGPEKAEKFEFKSLGQRFIESIAYKEFQVGSPQGPQAELKLSRTELKALFGTNPPTGVSNFGTNPNAVADSGWSAETTRTDIVTMTPVRPGRLIMDKIPQMPTSQTAVIYMEETRFGRPSDDRAFTGDKARAAGDGQVGDAYETWEADDFFETQLELTERNVPVRKIAIYLPVTDEQLEDVDQAAAYVDQRMRLMMNQRLDRQVILGNGTAPNLMGTNAVSGIQTQAKGADSIPDAIYKLRRKIMSDGYAHPDTILIHPEDWEEVVLLKTADGQYIWGHPSQPGPMMLWGVPVTETTALGTGTAFMGDYRTHSFFALRRGIDMQISNSHADFFIHGKQAIRMDMRGAMVHIRPKAFGKVTGL